MEGLVARPDGSEILKETCSGVAAEASAIGLQVAAGLKEQGAVELLRQARQGAGSGAAGND